VNKGLDDTITFNITENRSNISLDRAAPLPTIVRPVTIDGRSKGSSTTIGGLAFLNVGKQADGLTFGKDANGSSSGSKVFGLTVRFFTNGIVLNNVSNVQIGSPMPGGGDILIDNTRAGVEITGAQATLNRVLSSLIGIDPQDLQDTHHNGSGVVIEKGASGNIIGGLGTQERNVISGNIIAGVYVSNSNKNTIAGNYIGSDPTGAKPMGQRDGVLLEGNSTGNHIGTQVQNTNGVIAVPANLISSNTYQIQIEGMGATGNVVEGNWIGVDSSGKRPLFSSATSGIDLDNTAGNMIGGVLAGSANVISGNTESGILISHGSTKNQIINNSIGIGPDPNDTSVKPSKVVKVGLRDVTVSQNSGILVFRGEGGQWPKENVIEGNRIDNNATAGVLDDGKGNKILTNTFFGNGKGAIDLGTGVGAPVLTSAIGAPTEPTEIEGTLSSSPNTRYVIEFFGNSEPDPSGFGQGEVFLGKTTVTTKANGQAAFSATVPVSWSGYVSATATGANADGSTSQFSNNVPVAADQDSDEVVTVNSLTQTFGTSAGGTTVTISGTGLDAATQGSVLAAADRGRETVVLSSAV
jgi:parallel beta-helix repeat protein